MAELDRLRQLQGLANGYMIAARRQANINIVSRLNAHIKAKDLNEELSKAIEPFVTIRVAQEALANSKEPDRLKFFQLQQQKEQSDQIAFFSLRMLKDKFNATDNPVDADVIADALSVLDLDFNIMRSGKYFDNENIASRDEAKTDNRAALTYYIKLRQADREKIQFTDEAIDRFIAVETRNALSKRDAEMLKTSVRQSFPALGANSFYQAIANELKVRAMSDLYPPESAGIRITPPPSGVAMTPFDLFKYYQDTCAPFNVSLVEIDAEAYLPQVKEEPTTEQAKELHAKYWRVEPNPAVETPGFKRPRRVEVQYLAGSPTLPAYQKLPDLTQASSIVLSAISPTTYGSAPATMFTMASPFIAADLDTYTKLEQRKHDPDSQMATWNTSYLFGARTPVGASIVVGVKTLDSSVYMTQRLTKETVPAEPILRMIALLGGPPGPMQDLTAQAWFRHTAESNEILSRVIAGVSRLTAVMPTSAQSPASILGIEGDVYAYTLPPELPDTSIRQEYAAAQIRRQREAMFMADMTAFQKKLDELARPKEPKAKDAKPRDIKAEVAAYVQAFVAARPGLVLGGSKEARDRFTIASDEGLKPLNDRIISPPGETTTPWDSTFFPTNDSGRKAGDDLYRANWFPNPPVFDDPRADASQNYLAWANSEVAAYAYSKYPEAPAEVKAAVVVAWKLEKARELAKKAAEEFQAKVTELASAHKGNPDGLMRAIRDEAAARKLKLANGGFPLKMTRVEFVHPTQPGSNGSWSRFLIKKELITYPTDLMSRDVVGLRHKAAGDSVVVADQPRRHYYVATLLSKEERDLSIFVSTIYSHNAGTGGNGDDSLYRSMAKPDLLTAGFREDENMLRTANKVKLLEKEAKSEGK